MLAVNGAARPAHGLHLLLLDGEPPPTKRIVTVHAWSGVFGPLIRDGSSRELDKPHRIARVLFDAILVRTAK